MKKTFIVLCLSVFNYWCISADDYEVYAERAVAKKPITVLVYFAADNNLEPYTNDDLNELKKIGSNEHINILGYLNTRRPGENKITQKLIILPGRIAQDGITESKDSGDTKTLIDACAWAHTRFPSDSFVLVMWDHGSGSLNRFLNLTTPCFWWHRLFGQQSPAWQRACCYDDTTGNFFTDAKLQLALSTVCTKYRQGKKIDILAFDACLMACIEVAYFVQPYATYMVASQQTIPGTGFGYDRVLKKAAAGNTDIHSLVYEFITEYQAEYQGETEDYTLSALNLEKLPALIDHTNLIAKFMTSLLKSKDKTAVKKVIKNAARNSTRFDVDAYMDIGNFYQNLIDPIQAMTLQYLHVQAKLITELQEALTALNECVIAKVQGTNFYDATGLSIYFDLLDIDETYPSLIWSAKTPWLKFLQQYLRVR